MTPQTVTYTRRMPMEQYGYCELTATATIGDDENAHDAFMSLKEEVEKAISGEMSAASETVTEEPKKKTKAKVKAAKVEEEEEEINTEDTPDDDEGEEVVAPKAARKTKSKTSTYSRSNETHKALFAATLNEEFPAWKKTDASKAKAKKLSQSLDGTEFLDADGEVTMSFIALMRKGMK